MFARALIVVLLALNLGVAAWWLSRPAPSPPPTPPSSRGGAELRLLPMEAPATAASPAGTDAVVAEPDAAVATDAATVDVDAHKCLRIGPFADRAAAETARGELGASLQDPRVHEEPGQASRYRVLLPPAADREQAQATAARIAAAGFQDLFVLTQGEEANGIALGAYGSRDTADRRAEALRAAGFPAEVQAQGATAASRWWLLGASDTPAIVRGAFPSAREHDCAALPDSALR